MGESAVAAMKSYTHNTSFDPSHEHEQGDPIQALTTSISFGRFMSESLDWGKWSSFSHNRHLEEAEKMSRPGSVAEKKAYFEAHYKKIAAAKKVAALLEAENVANSNTVDAPCIINQTHPKSSTDLEYTEASKAPALYESEKADAKYVIEEHGNMQKNSNADNRLETDIAVNVVKTVSGEKGTVPAKDTSVLVTKKKHVITTSNSLASTSKSKLLLMGKTPTPAQLGKNTTITSSKVKVERCPDDRKRKIPQSLHMSINTDNFASNTNRKQEIFSSTSSVSTTKSKISFSRKPAIPVQPVKEAKAISRSNNKSLHMSISEDTHPIRNLKQESSSRAKIFLAKTLTSPTQPKKDITVTSRGEEAGGFVDKKRFFPNSMSVDLSHAHVSVTPKSETTSHTNLSTRCESKTRATTVSSPFSFRSEERAKKRKEFFKKIEEKKNVVNAGKVHMQIVKIEKADNGARNLRQSTKTAVDSSNHITTLPSNTRKILPTCLQSPKPGQKPGITNIIPDSNCQPHRRPPVKNGGYDGRRKVNKSLITIRIRRMFKP